MNILRFSIISLFVFFGLFFAAFAFADSSTIYFFNGKGCPHCAREEAFFEQWKKEDPNVEVVSYEIWYNKKNAELLQKVGKELNVKVSAVPFTVIGDKYITGYNDDSTTGKQIQAAVEYCKDVQCRDVVGDIINRENKTPAPTPTSTSVPQSIKLPFLGTINAQSLSLPVLTIFVALVDGFNPCAMWVLLFLIGLLFGMQDRFRMWTLGIIFLVASAMSYFVFMAAWLNLLLFIGFIVWIRVAIGGVALGAGIMAVRKWMKGKGMVCEVTEGQRQQKIFDKAKTLISNRNFLIAFGGIVLLAFAVNLVELMCSAGLPAFYTQVLSLSHLAAWQYYAYLLLYILIFLLDDILIFTGAMITLRITRIQGGYARYASLIGGVAMVVIGILLLFKPEWLRFG